MSAIDQKTIECWKANYGLQDREPDEALRWWVVNFGGKVPAGAVAALGLLIKEREAVRKDAQRYRWLRKTSDTMRVNISIDGNGSEIAETLDAAIDAAIAKDAP